MGSHEQTEGRAYVEENIFLATEVLFQLVRVQYYRMQQLALKIDGLEASDSEHQRALRGFLGEAMSFILAVDQLRRIAPTIPGGGPFRVWKNAFAQEAADQEEARHHFSHLDRSIRAAAKAGEPAFGSPAWVVPPSSDDDGSFAITFHMPGSLRAGQVSAEMVLGESIDRPVGNIRLRIAGETYDLSAAYHSVGEFAQQYEAFRDGKLGSEL